MTTVFHVDSGANRLDKIKITKHQRGKTTKQVSPRIKAMPIDDQSYYYTVPARKNHVLTAKNQVLQIISGVAWVSCGGQDYILKVGDAMTLSPQDDKVTVISGLKGKAVCYTLKD